MVLRTTRLEQLGHARQTARDVAGRGAAGLDTRERVARTDVVAFGHREDGVDRQVVARLNAAWMLDRLALVVDQHDGRFELDLLRTRAGVDDHLVGNAGGFIGFVTRGDAFDEVLILNLAGEVGDDRGRERIPVGHALTTLDLVAVAVPEAAAIDRLEGLADAAVGVDELDLHRTAVDHERAVVAFDDRSILETYFGVEGGFKRAFRRDLGCAADVERTHRELGARFADGLRGDDADSFADVDAGAACEVATVA